MNPLEQHVPDDLTTPSDGLTWPAPVTDSDILWLEPEPQPELRPAPAPVRGSADRLSLAQLLAAGATLEWHDAVAIVSDVADALVPDPRRMPAGALPAIEAIFLTADGRIQAQLVPNGGESLVAGFGRVLQALLQDKPTPANLRLLAWRATSEAGENLTVDEITRELARWERPGRLDKLKTLHERALAAPPPPPAAEAPVAAVSAPIAAPIAEPAPTPAPAPAPKPVVAPQAPVNPQLRSKQQIALIVAGAIACMIIGGAGAWLLLRPGTATDAPVATDAWTPAIAGDINLPADPRGSRATDAKPSAAARGAGAAAQRRAAAERTPTPAARGEKMTASAPSARTDAPSPQPAATTNIVGLPALSTVPAPRRPVVDTHIYRTGDAGVSEPILVKPYLPPRPHPEIPDSVLGVLEVLVDKRGLVETVHLKSPANRYREKWWLFTAKDWQFEPARKDGLPVRFLKRILLTDLNITEPQ